ncbi:disease resistance protein RUN1-like isoform X2 [Pyrus x bretschneideri]|uniref:disease resistance protein RUN1-like isoform X2 n=1 Tax=Pyrus x bretschneideri TaxID=225117 RepID=UPI00202DFC84|nr:disease resistance protein RUN1-like isoform X2 [Pyrus x bretschneideri]
MLHPPDAWMNFKKLLNAWKLGIKFCQYFMMWIPPMFETKWGLFQKPSTSTKKNFREDLAKVQHWGAALTKVGDIAGWTSKDRYETELIKEIVEAVWNKAYPRFTWLCQTETLIGIGTWSMGRIGKTTIARLVYERISHNCEVSSFLGNAREVLCNTWSPPSTKTASFHSLQGKVYTSLGRL